MRSSSLARVVMVTLGASVVITLGCGGSPSGPTPPPQASFSVRSISPNDGSSAAPTVATIAGTGFQSGATVTVDGSRVDATVLSATAISVTMPAHAAGRVNVIVINPPSEALAVRDGFNYVGPPVISELNPNIGSTAGGAPVYIKGTGLGGAATVTVGGIVTPFEEGWVPDDPIFLTMPAHAAGTAEVIVTDRFGQTARGVFTYASSATLDFNGDWQGWASSAGTPNVGARLELTVRGNTAVSVSCLVCPGGNCAAVIAPSLTLDPPPVVANGEFSYAGSGGVSITGKILSPTYASGSINTASCGSRQWEAFKRE
jgi:hypothetical protein